MNDFRFRILAYHHRLKEQVWTAASWAVTLRLIFALLTFGLTNFNSYRAGTSQGQSQQEQQNWNGQSYITITPDAAAVLQSLARRRKATAVEVYAIDYRLPGSYQGLWKAPDGKPHDRYASRKSAQWVLGQRLECSTSDQGDDFDSFERSIQLEVYCPIGHPNLALPSGFIVVRWFGKKPSSAVIADVQDELFDLVRLMAR